MKNTIRVLVGLLAICVLSPTVSRTIDAQSIFEDFTSEDTSRVDELRNWVVAHYDDASAYETVEGKLSLIQAILDNGWVEKDEAWKLQALGIAFGDALEQHVDELHWVIVEDEHGRDPALRWERSDLLLFPMSAIAKRIEAGERVNVTRLLNGYLGAIETALKRSD